MYCGGVKCTEELFSFSGLSLLLRSNRLHSLSLQGSDFLSFIFCLYSVDILEQSTSSSLCLQFQLRAHAKLILPRGSSCGLQKVEIIIPFQFFFSLRKYWFFRKSNKYFSENLPSDSECKAFENKSLFNYSTQIWGS